MSEPTPRLPELAPADIGEEARAFLDRWSTGAFRNADQNPVLMTLAHHPQLAELFSNLNIHLLTTSSLPVRQRQIAIMRTAWLCRCTYMWSSHLQTSQSFGLKDDMFEPVKRGADDPWFTPFERLIVRATDKLVADHTLDEDSWRALAAEWDARQMLDFLFTVGLYVAIAGVMNATRVNRREDLRALAARYGAPELPG